MVSSHPEKVEKWRDKSSPQPQCFPDGREGFAWKSPSECPLRNCHQKPLTEQVITFPSYNVGQGS